MGKSHRKHVSVIGIGDYPEMWVPEFLRSPVRIKRFWYIRGWDWVIIIWQLLTKPFRKKITPPEPALKVTLEGGKLTAEGGVK